MLSGLCCRLVFPTCSSNLSQCPQPRKAAAVVSGTGRCGRAGPASEMSSSDAVELLRPRAFALFLACFWILCCCFLWDPSARSSSPGTARWMLFLVLTFLKVLR